MAPTQTALLTVCCVAAGALAVLASAVPAAAQQERLAGPESPAAPAQVVAEIEGVQREEGTVGCVLFGSGEGFPGEVEKAVQRTGFEASARESVCLFSDLEPGTYAVAALHDANGNGRVDTNFFGAPKEDYGVSNNATRAFAPPRWEEARFRVEEGQTVKLRIRLQ